MTDADARVTLWLSEDLKETIDSEYINWRYESRSQWLREATETRIALEDALGARGVELPDDEADREELIGTIVRTGVAAVSDDALDGETDG